MAIDREEVLRIARLARLELEPDAVERFSQQLAGVLDHMTLLDELAPGAEEASPDSSPGGRELREDVETQGLSPEEATDGAPDPAEGFFRVPRSMPE